MSRSRAFDARDADELYENAAAIAWEHILRPGATLAVAARGTSDELRNTRFSALRVKDAVCDRLARVLGERPSVDTDCPDCRLSLTIRGDRASLQLDLSGDPLFKRLPCEATRPGAAHVLRPDYAALALAQVNWQQTCANALVNTGDAAAPAAENDAATAANRAKSDEPNASANSGCDLDAAASEEASAHSAQPIDRDSAPTAFPVLIDLCCAGGGITLEAASVLAGRAPGIDRERWGFLAGPSTTKPRGPSCTPTPSPKPSAPADAPRALWPPTFPATPSPAPAACSRPQAWRTA